MIALPNEFEYDPGIKELIETKVRHFEVLAEDLPIYIIHELSSGKNTVVYMSPKGLEALSMTLDEIRAMGERYYNVFFNQDDAVDYLAKWTVFAADYTNKGAWFTFFQQVRIKDSEQPVWFLSASTVIAYDPVQQTPLFSITLALRIHQYLPIVPKLERLIGENKFLKDNLGLFTLLTKREKEILCLMAQGIGQKIIAGNLFTSEKTVRTHRRNIKRKLGIRNEVDLLRFAQAFNIV